MIANKSIRIQQCANGWLLSYWLRHQSDMAEVMEVYPSHEPLFQRIRDLFAPPPQSGACVVPIVSHALAAAIQRDLTRDDDEGDEAEPARFPNPPCVSCGD